MAVPMMEAGSFVNATDCMTEAIKAYQRLGECIAESIVDARKNWLQEESKINSSMVCSLERQNHKMEEEDNGYFMYRQGVAIPDTLHARYMPSIIVFNLALMRHLQATKTMVESSRRQLMRKSSQLYIIAYQAYVEVGGSKCGLLAIAIASNNALIYRELGDRDRSQRCLKTLHFALAQLMRNGDTEVVPFAYDFLRNVLTLRGFQDSEAYAAASA